MCERKDKGVSKVKNIFDKTKLNQLDLKNRLFRSATWLALADDDGNLTEPIFETYRELARGGVAAIVTGITTVSPHDAYLDGIAQFHDDKFIEQHKKFTDMIHEYDCKIFMQTAMVDSVFYIGEDLYKIPIGQLTTEHINEFVNLFRDAAARAKSAGYDGIQLHVAHNFFLSKFISPMYNNRHDEYGGSPEKRAHVLGKILDEVRGVVGKNFCVIAKINCDDFSDGGLNIHDCIVACQTMKAHGVDAVEISGNYTSREARAGANEGYFQKYAAMVKSQVDIPIILVGGHRSAESMNKILLKKDIEYLSLSRALVREPDIVNRWKSGDLKPSACIGCNTCYRTPGHKCVFVLRGKK